MLTIGPEYFRCMQARLILGREFTEIDGSPGHEAAIINHIFANRHCFCVDDRGCARLRIACAPRRAFRPFRIAAI